MLEVGLDKGEDNVHTSISNNLCNQAEASACCHCQIPSIVVILALLFRQSLCEERDEELQSLLDKVMRCSSLRLARSHQLHEEELLITHRGPKFHGRNGNLLGAGFDRVPRERPNCIHVWHQEVVVLSSNLHETLEGCNLHLRHLGLAYFLHYRHDKVPLVLTPEILLSQYDCMVESSGGLKFCTVVSIPHALHHRCKNVICDFVLDLRPILLN
mmetsp:Transcript_85121/g.150555  ORF Transcript_85121/g.150555 Transcript_85121/m.150555 type:complete len:214 (+) Transcript_85121:1579-2220(+)